MSQFIQKSGCYLIASELEQFKNLYKMKELDEVRGPLQHIETIPGGLIAIIANIPILLPLEMEGKLQNMLGHNLGILRCEGYRFREI